jgi:hypothetical protein
VPWVNTAPAGWLQALSALGNVGRGFTQGQDSAARRQLIQQEAEKNQQTQNAMRLAALFRGASQPLAPFASPGGGGMAPPAPQPAAPTPGPSGPGLPYQGGVYQPEMDPTLGGAAGAPLSGGEPIRTAAPAVGEPIPLDTPTPPVSNVGDGADGGPLGGPHGIGTSARPDAGGGSGELMMTPPGGTPIPISQLLGQRQSFSTILDTIASKAPPGTDPAVIYQAAALVHKDVMADNRDPMSLAVLKMAFPTAQFTMAEAGRMERAKMASGDRAAGRATTERGQDIVSGDKAAGRATTERGQDIVSGDKAAGRAIANRRLNDQEYQQAYQRGTGQQKAQLGELHRQLGELDRQINQDINQGKTPATELLKRRNDLAAQERAIASQLGYAPQPEAPAP